MRKSQIVAVVGYLLIVAGLMLALWSSPLVPATGSATETIPTGNYYRFWETKMTANGHVSGSFEVQGGGAVELFIFTEDQYDKWASGNEPGGAIAHAVAPAGNFSLDLPGTGNFYLIVAHAPGSNSEQTFSLTYKVEGS